MKNFILNSERSRNTWRFIAICFIIAWLGETYCCIQQLKRLYAYDNAFAMIGEISKHTGGEYGKRLKEIVKIVEEER